MMCDQLEKILSYVNEKGRVNAYEVAALFCDEPDLIEFVYRICARMGLVGYLGAVRSDRHHGKPL